MLNRKRLLSLTLALLMVCSLLPTAAFAQDICAHEWEWDEDDGPFYQICALCDAKWAPEEITGPCEVSPVSWALTPDGTMTVSGEGEFDEDYFYGDDLPEGQLPWEPYAPYVTTLIVEEGITYFYGTPDLIGLTAAHFPTSLQEFHASKVLGGSPNLTTVTVAEGNPRYYTVANVVFDRSTNTLVCYPGGKTDSTYTVPGCDIGDNAFCSNKYLESLVVEEGAARIDDCAFEDCKNLTEISLPISLAEVGYKALPSTLETTRYAGSETQFHRIFRDKYSGLLETGVVFGVARSDIVAQWNLKHTILNLKGEAKGASYVLANFYQPGGQMVKSVLYTAQQAADGVAVNDPDTDLSDCSAKIVVLDSTFAPIYDCTVPDGDTDYTSLAEFEGWLYGMESVSLEGSYIARYRELVFSDDRQTLILDAAKTSYPSYMSLGQKYKVTYNRQTNDLVSMESADVSVTGTVRVDQLEWITSTDGNIRNTLFTLGNLKHAPFDSISIPCVSTNYIEDITPTELRKLTSSAISDEYTAIDQEGDGDIDYLLVRPVKYAQVVKTGANMKYGDYIDVLQVNSGSKTTRYYLEELQGADDLPNALKKGDIVKLTIGIEDYETRLEVLPAESMTLEKIVLNKGKYTFDGRTFSQAENGWDLSGVLVNDALDTAFTVVYDGDLVVWAEAEIVPLDAAEIYADGDQIDPAAKDAVELIYALGLMSGDANGKFNPEGTVTRAEMARIIYIILNYGKDDKAVNYTGANLFSDVEPGSWYEGYVNYCASNKLIQGQSDGTFGPNETLTCAKAAKLLLTAIGYSAEERGYVGDSWERNVLSDASILGLLDGYKANTTAPAPRQWVAKMVENCLLKCYTYDGPQPPFSSLLTGNNVDDEYLLMGEKYFGLTKDSEVYRSVYIESSSTSTSTLTYTVKAALVLEFADEVDQFENLGDNDNVYITFDTLPTHGRLVYNFGLSGQQEVSVGSEYYLNGESDKLQLSKVTYVPAYSADKTTKTDTFAVTGFSAKGNEVKGTVKIDIQYAQKSVRFTDVTDSYYADSVDFVYNQGITTGMTTTAFNLSLDVNRGLFVTYLWRAAGSPAVTDVTNDFTDVSASDYYYNAVMWAVSNDLVAGVGSNQFAHADTLTREQALTLLYRFAVNYLGRDSNLGSPDGITDYADVSPWAQVSVQWAVAHGFVGDDALEPQSVLDRGTTAVYLHGALTGLAGSSGGNTTPEPDPTPTPNPYPDAYTVLVYAISHISDSGALSLDVIAPDGMPKTLYVTEVDGETPSVIGFALPAFYQAVENTDGEVSLTHITSDFAEQGIYACKVSKYVYKTDTITLDDADNTELTAAEIFTLYAGNFDTEGDSLEDVWENTPYIFFALDGEAVYGVNADTPTAVNDLLVRLGGLQDVAAVYSDSYFIDPDARYAVGLLYDLHLMVGDDKGNFRPDGTVTRAEVAKMIYEIFHYGVDDRGEDYVDRNLFTDVDPGAWYEGYVTYCAINGLMGGKADGTFAPYETATCPQMAKILLQAMGYDPEARGYVGADWSSAVLVDAATLGLLDGYKTNVQTNAPRQWMAVMIANALQNCYTYVGDDPVKFATLVTEDIAATNRESYILMGEKYYDLT